MEKSKKKEVYLCRICGVKYNDKNWAEKCEDWCRHNNSCNISITKHRIK